jgi:queuosine precursor transporter
MINELIFILHASLLSIFLLIALRFGKESLIALVSLYGILANLFVTKQITLFTFNATASDAFSVAAILGLNILQEYFGAALAKKAIWINFLCLIVYTLAAYLHLSYIPSSYDTMQHHFYALLQAMPRITLASISIFLVVQYLDRFLYGVLQDKFGHRHFLLRNYASLIICQLIDTVLFSFVGLYGIVENIGTIVVVSYVIKVFAIMISNPWLALSKKIYKDIPSN